MSLRSKIITWLLFALDVRQRVKKMASAPPRGTHAYAAHKFSPKLHVVTGEVAGCAYATVSPSDDPKPQPHIFFLHGGGYIFEASALHRKVAEYWVRKHGIRVTCMTYPLAPEHTCSTALSVTQQAYKALHAAYPEDTWTVAGDSAGGGLALALAQQMRGQNEPARPTRLVLVSPWLDIGLTHPDMLSLQPMDPLLDIDTLRERGRWYAGALPLNAPEVSPQFGGMDQLGDVMLLAGGAEIFLPDCLQLRDKLTAACGSRVHWTLHPEMLHDWILLPIPEARQTLDAVAAFVKN